MQFITTFQSKFKFDLLFTLDEGTEQYFKDCLDEISSNTLFLKSDEFIQHGDTSVLWHSIAVAYYSFCFFNFFKINCNRKSLIYGALLHDYFLYDWHVNDKSHNLHGFKHPTTALNNAKKHYTLNSIEIDIIKNHMFPLTLTPPHHRESIIVSAFDKICSTYEVFNRNTYPQLRKKFIFN